MTWDSVVIGAGSAGVTASRALTEAGVDHVLLERGDVGNTWSTQRWDSFRLNTPGSMNQLLGELRADEYSTLEETVALLRERARGLPLRTGTTVTSVRRVGGLLQIATPEDVMRARTVVVASGPKNVPLLPPKASRLAPHVTSLHAAAYRSAAALPEGGVLVVGGGQSGAQIAQDLRRSGRRVWLASSRIGRYRAWYRGRALLDWHVKAGWWATPPQALSDPAAMRVPTPLIGSGGRDLGLPALARMGVHLLGRLADVDGTRLRFVGDVGDFVAFGDQVAVDLEKVVDDYLVAAGIDAPPAQPDDGRGPIEVTRCDAIDLDGEAITVVVWCTGFGGDFSWLEAATLDAYGMPVLDPCGGAVGEPAVRFVGMPWQSTRASAILHGIPLDAERAVTAVTEQLRPQMT